MSHRRGQPIPPVSLRRGKSHQGPFHKPFRAPNSSQNNSLLLFSTRPHILVKAHWNMSSTFLNRLVIKKKRPTSTFINYNFLLFQKRRMPPYCSFCLHCFPIRKYAHSKATGWHRLRKNLESWFLANKSNPSSTT